MKEFACKHPFITFLIIDEVVTGIVNLGRMIYNYKTKKHNDIMAACRDSEETDDATEEETTNDEPAGDIQ